MKVFAAAAAWAVWLPCAMADAAPPASAWAGRPLQEVLAELRGLGLNLVYSSDLVPSDLRVRKEPRAGTPRDRLGEALSPHGLAVHDGPAGTLVVVRRARGRSGRAANDGAMQLGFNDTVDVADRAEPKVGPQPVQLQADDVLRTPGALDNVFRALQAQPGVTGAGLYETRISVRGGGPDQNLTVMDGVEIYNPFRLFGAVAGFNPETLGGFEFTAGAFPARYGDRLSSLLVVETRDGRRDRRLSGAVTASVTDASGVAEGRLPGPGDGSWLFAARRTYYDLVAERLLEDGLPTFNDVQVRLAWRKPSGARLAVTALRSREDTDADFSDPVDTVDIVTDGAHELAAVNLAVPVGRNLVARSVASFYRFSEAIDFDLQGLSDTRVSFDRQGRPRDQLLTLGLTRRVEVRDLAFRQDLSLALGPRPRLEAGFELHRLESTWRQSLRGDRSDEAPNGSSILFGPGLPAVLDSELDSTRAAAFVQYRAPIGSRLVIEPGLRLERPGSVAGAVLSPRLAVSVAAGRAGMVKAAAGLHYQSPGYEKLIHSDYFLDLSSEARGDLKPERGFHVALALERSLGHGFDASVEGYYRDFSRLIVGRLESETERAERLAVYDYPPALQWGLPTHPLITSHPVNGADGHAYGLLAIVRKSDSPDSRFAGWLSYAWGKADRSAYGRTYPFDYDRRHGANLVGYYRAGRRWEVGVTGRLASGRPTTPPRGVLVLGEPDADDRDRDGNRAEFAPARDERGNPVYVTDPGGFETLNSGRLPLYLRVDARLSFRPAGPTGRWLFYVEVLNLLDRQNAASYDWDLHQDPGAARPRIEVTTGQDGVPLVPSFGVRWRF